MRCAPARPFALADVPAGMSKEEYEALKAKEAAKTKGKNLAITGVTTFRSRVLDFRAADEAKAMGEKKAYRFPDKSSGNKNNYVRAVGGRSSFQSSKEYQQMLKEKEMELKKAREASAKISGAAGGVRASAAQKQRAAAAAAAESKKSTGGLGGFFGGLFGGK